MTKMPTIHASLRTRTGAEMRGTPRSFAKRPVATDRFRASAATAEAPAEELVSKERSTASGRKVFFRYLKTLDNNPDPKDNIPPGKHNAIFDGAQDWWPAGKTVEVNQPSGIQQRWVYLTDENKNIIFGAPMMVREFNHGIMATGFWNTFTRIGKAIARYFPFAKEEAGALIRTAMFSPFMGDFGVAQFNKDEFVHPVFKELENRISRWSAAVQDKEKEIRKLENDLLKLNQDIAALTEADAKKKQDLEARRDSMTTTLAEAQAARPIMETTDLAPLQAEAEEKGFGFLIEYYQLAIQIAANKAQQDSATNQAEYDRCERHYKDNLKKRHEELKAQIKATIDAAKKQLFEIFYEESNEAALTQDGCKANLWAQFPRHMPESCEAVMKPFYLEDHWEFLVDQGAKIFDGFMPAALGLTESEFDPLGTYRHAQYPCVFEGDDTDPTSEKLMRFHSSEVMQKHRDSLRLWLYTMLSPYVFAKLKELESEEDVWGNLVAKKRAELEAKAPGSGAKYNPDKDKDKDRQIEQYYLERLRALGLQPERSGSQNARGLHGVKWAELLKLDPEGITRFIRDLYPAFKTGKWYFLKQVEFVEEDGQMVRKEVYRRVNADAPGILPGVPKKFAGKANGLNEKYKKSGKLIPGFEIFRFEEAWENHVALIQRESLQIRAIEFEAEAARARVRVFTQRNGLLTIDAPEFPLNAAGGPLDRAQVLAEAERIIARDNLEQAYLACGVTDDAKKAEIVALRRAQRIEPTRLKPDGKNNMSEAEVFEARLREFEEITQKDDAEQLVTLQSAIDSFDSLESAYEGATSAFGDGWNALSDAQRIQAVALARECSRKMSGVIAGSKAALARQAFDRATTGVEAEVITELLGLVRQVIPLKRLAENIDPGLATLKQGPPGIAEQLTKVARAFDQGANRPLIDHTIPELQARLQPILEREKKSSGKKKGNRLKDEEAYTSARRRLAEFCHEHTATDAEFRAFWNDRMKDQVKEEFIDYLLLYIVRNRSLEAVGQFNNKALEVKPELSDPKKAQEFYTVVESNENNRKNLPDFWDSLTAAEREQVFALAPVLGDPDNMAIPEALKNLVGLRNNVTLSFNTTDTEKGYLPIDTADQTRITDLVRADKLAKKEPTTNTELIAICAKYVTRKTVRTDKKTGKVTETTRTDAEHKTAVAERAKSVANLVTRLIDKENEFADTKKKEFDFFRAADQPRQESFIGISMLCLDAVATAKKIAVKEGNITKLVEEKIPNIQREVDVQIHGQHNQIRDVDAKDPRFGQIRDANDPNSGYITPKQFIRDNSFIIYKTDEYGEQTDEAEIRVRTTEKEHGALVQAELEKQNVRLAILRWWAKHRTNDKIQAAFYETYRRTFVALEGKQTHEYKEGRRLLWEREAEKAFVDWYTNPPREWLEVDFDMKMDPEVFTDARKRALAFHLYTVTRGHANIVDETLTPGYLRDYARFADSKENEARLELSEESFRWVQKNLGHPDVTPIEREEKIDGKTVKKRTYPISWGWYLTVSEVGGLFHLADNFIMASPRSFFPVRIGTTEHGEDSFYFLQAQSSPAVAVLGHLQQGGFSITTGDAKLNTMNLRLFATTVVVNFSNFLRSFKPWMTIIMNNLSDMVVPGAHLNHYFQVAARVNGSTEYDKHRRTYLRYWAGHDEEKTGRFMPLLAAADKSARAAQAGGKS